MKPLTRSERLQYAAIVGMGSYVFLAAIKFWILVLLWN
jgi:hypothetical protein